MVRRQVVSPARDRPGAWLDEDGKTDRFFDVHKYVAMCKAHCEQVGLGAELITKLFR